jgi:hypothetical protein
VSPRNVIIIGSGPAGLTAAQWNALEEMMEWSPAHRAFLFRPDGRSLVEILNFLPAPEARSAEAAVSPTPLGERPGTFERQPSRPFRE